LQCVEFRQHLIHIFVASTIEQHDADHPGIPNSALAEENPVMAETYKNKSVAEQNSVDLCWDLFMSDKYSNLRNCICADTKELSHFRQLMVNMVLATDVMDKELGALRKARWNKAFSNEKEDVISQEEDRNRKATIVIEHLIQASDVSHTMQHWHVYRKWNERLFMEMYHAFKQGRISNDPSMGWYEGEKGFLDFYVMPLAQKLDTCGVFGVSSDEFQFYCSENRKSWDVYGQQLVEQYIEKYNQTLGSGIVPATQEDAILCASAEA
jgi:hypothetical protein